MLPLIVFLRIITFLPPESYQPEGGTTVTKFLFSYLDIPLLQSILGVILIFIQAALVNRIVIMNRLTGHITLFSGVIYATLVSLFPSYHYFTEYLIANTFVLLSIASIMKIYHKSFNIISAFNAGLYMGLAIAIAPDYLPIGLYGIIAIVFFTASIKNIFQYIIGGLTIVILNLSLQYGLNFGSEGLGAFIPTLNKEVFYIENYLNRESLFIAVVLLYALYLSRPMKMKKSVAARKKIESLFFFLLLSFFVFLLYPPTQTAQMLLVCIPFGIIIGIDLSRKKNLTINIVYLLILGLIFFLHFEDLLF